MKLTPYRANAKVVPDNIRNSVESLVSAQLSNGCWGELERIGVNKSIIVIKKWSGHYQDDIGFLEEL